MILVYKYENGRYAGMDHASGGYPYAADNVFQPYQWQGKPIKDLKHYKEMFPELILTRIEVTLNEVQEQSEPIPAIDYDGITKVIISAAAADKQVYNLDDALDFADWFVRKQMLEPIATGIRAQYKQKVVDNTFGYDVSAKPLKL